MNKAFKSEEIKLTSEYKTRNPKRKNHNGVDYTHKENKQAPIYSVANGTIVTVAFQKNGAGNYIVIKSNGFYHLYMHLSKTLVKKGQSVKEGQQIGNMGNTGNSTGACLHFEVRKSRFGRAIDPLPYIEGRQTLRIGMTGEDVKYLQKKLGFRGKALDGIFGEDTYRAVKEFQIKKGFEDDDIDGIVGKKTWGTLQD